MPWDSADIAYYQWSSAPTTGTTSTTTTATIVPTTKERGSGRGFLPHQAQVVLRKPALFAQNGLQRLNRFEVATVDDDHRRPRGRVGKPLVDLLLQILRRQRLK